MYAKGAKRLAGFDGVIINIPCYNEDRSDEPSTEGTRRNRGVVVVINHGTNLGVWGVLAKL